MKFQKKTHQSPALSALLKISLLLLTLFFLRNPLSAQEGSLSGAGKVRLSQTKYFDIIYSEKNLQSAALLYENADSIFEELAAAYGIEPYFRLPLVITSTVQQFNAYYSDSPFNRIVIYDTAQIEELAVFSQTLLSTFTHELTHALTYNIKSKSFITASKIFGDVISNHFLTVTNGIAEGATVAYESSKGEGRLNDAYALQMLRQAKIENLFPTYSDVKGASDAYPRNSFYYFNGAFTEYLQQKYGMEKYSRFWYLCINSALTAASAFKKSYGIKLKDAWKSFEETMTIPFVKAADPVTAGLARDFFIDEDGKISIKNKAGALYSNLSSSQKGLAFIDESCDTIYYAAEGKVKKLFTKDYIDSIKLSYDGRFMALGYYTLASPTIKHCAALYDLEQNKWISVPGNNYVCPSVISDGKDYYFAAQCYKTQTYSICIKKIEITGSRIKVCAENLIEKEFGEEEVPTAFTDLGQGNFAFILKDKLDYSICISNAKLSDIQEFPVPLERMKITSLSAEVNNSNKIFRDSNRLIFSWAQKETLPRLGYLDLNKESYILSEENISGGIYTPVVFEEKLYYTGRFFKDNKLLELVNPQENLFELPASQEKKDAALLNASSLNAAPINAAPSAPASSQTEISSPVEKQIRELPYKPFSPFKYMFDGVLIPVGGINSSTPTLGFTYYTSLPWYSSLTMLSGGYDISTKSGIFDLSYDSGTDTSLFQYSLYSSFALDKYGFKNLSGKAQTITSFDFGKRSAISLSLEASASLGRTLEKNMNSYLSTLEFAALTYSNVIKTGPGTYERGGLKAAAGVLHSYKKQTEPSPSELLDLYDVEFDLALYIPKLIPVLCLDNYTYNLPTKIKTSLFSLNSSSLALASINSETLIFGYDIQKAMPGISALFINDLIFTFAYTGGFDYQTKDLDKNWHFLYVKDYLNQITRKTLKYKNYYTFKFSLGLTPNIGSAANSQMRNNLYLCLHLGKKDQLPEKIFTFGFEAKF